MSQNVKFKQIILREEYFITIIIQACNYLVIIKKQACFEFCFFFFFFFLTVLRFGGSEGKESACTAGGLDSIPGLGRFPGEDNGYPLQYYCLEISIDRGAWRALIDGVTTSWA